MHRRRAGTHQRQVHMHCAESVCSSAESVSKSGQTSMRQLITIKQLSLLSQARQRGVLISSMNKDAYGLACLFSWTARSLGIESG
jgi:hypothetical protein